jgi:hypothetical protein
MNGTDLRRDFRDGNAGELGSTGGIEMAKQGGVLEHPLPDAAFSVRIRTFGALTLIGGALLTIGAILIDLGWFVDLPAIASLGNALSAISGLGLLFLPIGLRASRIGGTGVLATAGTVSLVIGICLASIVDLPAILDPTDLEAGGAMGPIGLLLLSIGFLAWFVAIRRAGGLAAVHLSCRRFVVPPDLSHRPASTFRDPERQTIVYPACRGTRYAATHHRDGRTRASVCRKTFHGRRLVRCLKSYEEEGVREATR